MSPSVKAFFDNTSKTISYVVYEKEQSACAIIDSVLDFDPKSGRINTQSADTIIQFIKENRLLTEWILETHAHADHLSAAPYLRERLGGKIAIGHHITDIQKTFKPVFNSGQDLATDGKEFDKLWQEDEPFTIGQMKATALYVPGHTPVDIAYLIGDAVFVGDTLFMPDVGTARCDFPGGNAQTLYRSIQKILSLPAQTRLFMCHDYPPAHREAAWETTVAQQRAENIHIKEGITEEQFIAMRTQRDATLDMPALILPSLQVNICAGKLPAPEKNGIAYLKIPLNVV